MLILRALMCAGFRRRRFAPDQGEPIGDELRPPHASPGPDQGAPRAWSPPKGLPDPGESELAAAVRAFEEETGIAPRGPFLDLGALTQKGGKLVRCWAFEGEADAVIAPGQSQFEMEWPPRSGRRARFAEVDDARLFGLDEALEKISPGQAGFLLTLADRLR